MMKKWLAGLLSLILLAGVLLYKFSTGPTTFNTSRLIKANHTAVTRFLVEGNRWNKWWPGTVDKDTRITDSSFTFHGYEYIISKILYNSILINISKQNKPVANTSLILIDSTVNYIHAVWEGNFTGESHKNEAKKLKTDMDSLLEKMETFFSNTRNVYGLDITVNHVSDSTLLFTYDSVKGYPGTGQIYRLVDELKEYVAENNAKITGYPMLNIYTSDSIIYQLKVAIPLDKKLPGKGRINYRWMLPGGYILVAEVKGDNQAVDHAFTEVDRFANDYHHIAPAISFYSLITDRQVEKDSTKWITRIYYPIMQ